MAKLIKDLINFEDVEEVIKIRKSGQEEDIVSKYVISEKIKEHLLYMFKLLNSDTHKSFNIVGNYGTGKSHLLAFISAVLEKREIRKLINEPEVREVVKAFQRQFAVVKFECPAAKEVPLRKIFYDNIQEQLEAKYDIDIDDIDLQRDYDNKRNVQRIIDQIKEENPELGLLVIVDEISDFLKQKDRTDMTYDLNFLREIGEVSQETDFLYIGAMQEHVFTNPKYIDQAENIARIAERFVDINITKEDIKRVISQRIVNKNANQRVELEDLISNFRQYFTNLSVELDNYLDLFPIHPYVISVFEDLPYFENRGIIHFASKNVSKILSKSAPEFITYDLIYDLIDETHEIRNLEEISKVIEVVKVLDSKVDLLEERLREPAKKIIKALAVLKMLGKTHLNGATVQELANTLLIIPPSRTIFDEDIAKDNIRRVLHNISKVTVGQFISYDKESDYYYIDVENIINFDAHIEQQIEKQDKSDWEGTFKKLLAKHLDLTDANSYSRSYPYLYDDTAFWKSRRSFREGYLIIGKKDDGPLFLPERDEKGKTKDYTVVLHSPFANHDLKQIGRKELIIGTPLEEEPLGRLKRIAAAETLAREGTHRNKFNDIAKKETEQFLKEYLIQLTAEGYAIYGGVKEQIKNLPPERYGNVEDVLGHLKSYFFEEYFNDEYPQYPKFKRDITLRNIETEVAKSIISLDKTSSLLGLDENAKSYLDSFGAIKEGKIYSDGSPIIQLIIGKVANDSGQNKVTSLEDLVNELNKKPYGIQKEFSYLLLACLLYNGEVVFVKNGGARIYAHEFSQQFKKGLELFEEIKYLEQERDLDVALLIKLFDSLGLQSGLVKDKNSRTEAVKDLQSKATSLKQELLSVRNGFSQFNENTLPELPWGELNNLIDGIASLDGALGLLLDIKKVADLGRLKIDYQWIDDLKEVIAKLNKLESLVGDMGEIKTGVDYKRAVEKDLDKLGSFCEPQAIIELREIARDQQEIYGNIKNLLKEEQRRPLKGKFAQYKDRYKKLYYHAHEGNVGSKVNWSVLDEITQNQKYKSLALLKNLTFFSPSEYNNLALEVNNLKQQRCQEFNVDSLEHLTFCSNCHFPLNYNREMKIGEELKALNQQIKALWNKWEKQLFEELKKLKDKVQLLSKEEYKQIIEELMTKKKLPELLPPDLLQALTELTSDLKQVDFNLKDFHEQLIARSSVLTVNDLDEIFAEFKNNLLHGQDCSKVRIRIVDEQEETVNENR